MVNKIKKIGGREYRVMGSMHSMGGCVPSLTRYSVPGGRKVVVCAGIVHHPDGVFTDVDGVELQAEYCIDRNHSDLNVRADWVRMSRESYMEEYGVDADGWAEMLADGAAYLVKK